MAWWLAYEELFGDMDKEYPIMNDNDIKLSGGYEWTPGSPWPPYPKSDYYYDYTRNDPNRKNPFTDPIERERAFKVTGNSEEKEKLIYESPDGGKTVYQRKSGEDPSQRIRLQDDCYPTFHSSRMKPSIQKAEYKKYEEDKGIKDLQDYITSTYNGHYTSKGSNVQTLDLIESVGDAESFCRSNAIKYLSRYDKKGQAKRDILKAMHYCLLLYYFSGQTQDETPTSGYETF